MSEILVNFREKRIRQNITVKRDGKKLNIHEYIFDIENEVDSEIVKDYILNLYERQLKKKEYSYIQIAKHYPGLVSSRDKNNGWRSTNMFKKGEDLKLNDFQIDSDGFEDENLNKIDSFIIMMYVQ